MEEILSNKSLVGIIVASTILSCGIYFGEKKTVAPQERYAIEMNNNVIVNMGSDLTHLDPDQFQSIIRASLKGREKRILGDSIDFLRPAMRDPGADITFDQNDSLRISPEAIMAFPKQKPEPEETMEVYENIDLTIRAIDLDSTKTGWAALIPAISDHRIKVQLAPSIDPLTLMANPKIKANVTVLFRETDKGRPAPFI